MMNTEVVFSISIQGGTSIVEFRRLKIDAVLRYFSVSWIPPDLITETQTVWSKVYGRWVNEFEAVSILLGVKKVASVLRRSVEGARS